jgi:hypothetical protein
MATNADDVTIVVYADTPEHLKAILKIFFRIDTQNDGTSEEVTVPTQKAYTLMRLISTLDIEYLHILEVCDQFAFDRFRKYYS